MLKKLVKLRLHDLSAITLKTARDLAAGLSLPQIIEDGRLIAINNDNPVQAGAMMLVLAAVVAQQNAESCIRDRQLAELERGLGKLNTSDRSKAVALFKQLRPNNFAALAAIGAISPGLLGI